MPQRNAARVALFRDFLKPENKNLLVPREERVAEMVVEGKSYDEIAGVFNVTVARVI
jgi:DNA-binding CsgD family transcriptional regulator